MKAGGLRILVAMVVLAAGIYFFVIKGNDSAPKHDDGKTIWADKMSAVAKMKLDLGTIAQAENISKTINGKYIECGPNPSEIPDYITNWNKDAADGWNELDVMLGSKTWFQYEVEVTGEDSFVVYARTYAEGTLLEYTMDEEMNLRKSK